MTAAFRSARVALLAAPLCASVAGAADWSLSGRFSQGAGFGVVGGDSPRATSSVGFSAIARAPDWNLKLSPGVTAGLNENGFNAKKLLAPDLVSSFELRRPRHTYTAGLSFIPQFVDQAENNNRNNDGQGDILQTSYSGSLGMTYAATPRDSLSIRGAAGGRFFLGDNGGNTESWNAGLSGGWNRSMSPDFAGNLNAGYRMFGGGESDGHSFSLTGGGRWRATPELSFNGSIGPSLTFRQRDGQGSDVTPGVDASFGLSYRASPDTSFNAGLTQSVDQDDDGVLVNRSAFNAGVRHNVNNRMNLNFSASGGMTRGLDGGGSDDSTYFRVGPSVSYALTRSWAVRADYSLRGVDDDDGFELDDALSFSFSRSLDLLR